MHPSRRLVWRHRQRPCLELFCAVFILLYSGERKKYEVVSIDKQEINTQVFAKDGETIVLGGVFFDTITKGVDKVPLLGDIPGIKRLFSKESERHQKRELVIFVTPHILKQGERMEMAKKEKHFKQVEKVKK